MTTLDLVGHLDPEDRAAHLAAILGEVGRRVRAAPPVPSVKACSRCKEEKPTDAFARDRNRKDGLQPSCRVCHARARSM